VEVRNLVSEVNGMILEKANVEHVEIKEVVRLLLILDEEFCKSELRVAQEIIREK
jgi:hypothetical protein